MKTTTPKTDGFLFSKVCLVDASDTSELITLCRSIETENTHMRYTLEWLLKNSCIVINGIYVTSMQSLESAINAAEPANNQLSDGPAEPSK